jgi:hypothetical protein
MIIKSGGNPMTFTELLNKAKSHGYIAVYNGATTVPIEQFTSEEEYDYVLKDNGVISYFDSTGFEWFSKMRFVRVFVICGET